MTELQGFPMLDQLADLDEPNREYDCVPTSIAAALRYLIGGSWTGAQVKDAVYGKAYVGGTAAEAYIDYCAHLGVRLWHIDGDGPALVKATREQIAQRHPVLATEPDPYSKQPGWTHVIVFHKASDGPGWLTAMDPFGQGGHDVTLNDDQWAALFQFGQVWALAPMKGEQTMPGVPQGWSDDGTTLKAPNGEVVVMGFRKWILEHNWDPANLPLEHEQSLPQIELSNPGLGAGSRQRFRQTTLEWTASRGVFEAWTGQELITLERLLKEQVSKNQPIQLSPTTRQTLQELTALLQKILN